MHVVYNGKIVKIRFIIKAVKHDKFIIEIDGGTIKVPEPVCQNLDAFLKSINPGDRVVYRSSKYIVRQVMRMGGWNHLLLKRESDGCLIRGFIDASQCKKIAKIEATL